MILLQIGIGVENSRLVENEISARAEAELAISEKDNLLKEIKESEHRYQVLAQSIPQVSLIK